ncbi:MAG: sialidase family protein [Phycisphaerales bacterium]
MPHLARASLTGTFATLVLLVLPLTPAAAQTGVQVNIDPNGFDIIGDAANEPSIAVSPIDPSIVVVGWRDFPTVASDARFAGVAYSHDGGVTWTNNGPLPAPPDQPANAQGTDPLIVPDSDGTLYYWSEIFRPNPPTKHYVYQSVDGGVTWPIVNAVQDPATPGDKEWMAIDRTGGIGDGFIHAGWNNFDLGGHCYVRSTDGGVSFSDPIRIADEGGTQWMIQYAVGIDGEVYAAWRNTSRNWIYITKSTNANDPAQAPRFDAFGGGGQNGLDLQVARNNDPGFMNINPVGFHQLYLDVNRSNGPHRGEVYLLWSSDRNDHADIEFARSVDGGQTWQTNIRVNDDAFGNDAYQWMPAMGVAPNGRIDAIWFDTRNDLGDPTPESELWYAFSEDGGVTWSPNRRLAVQFSTNIGWPVQQKIGDYITMVSDDEGAHIAYAATHNGGQDVWHLRANPFLLEVPPLVAGQPTTITVRDARPNASVWLGYSVTGRGDSAINQLDVTVELLNPVQAGARLTTDANGDAEWTLNVPPGAAGLDLWIQSVQFGAASNVVATTVN